MEDIIDNSSINKVFEHYSGNLYVLIGVSNQQATKSGYEEQAFYVDENMVMWSRPLKAFEKNFTVTDKEPWIVIKKNNG